MSVPRHRRHAVAIATGILGVLLGSAGALAAPLLVDRGERVEDLWLFPSTSDPRAYFYIPQRARLALDEHGEPLFSFTFYVLDRPAEGTAGGGTVKTLARADGGAIVHFLLEYATDPELVEKAERTLRERLGDGELRVAGPIVFENGTYSVVSSVLGDGGAPSPVLLDRHPAPVLEGQRVALSFHLEPEEAGILLATFKTATPDLSVTFDLGFQGLADAYDAEMIIDWEKAAKSLRGDAELELYIISARAAAAVERAFQDGAIELRVAGEDPDMERLTELAYEKAMDVLYAPVELDEVPESERRGLSDALAALLGRRKNLPAGIDFGAHATVRLKDLRSEGRVRLGFEKRATVDRHALLTVNLADLHRRHGDDGRYFRVEAGADRDFDQRRVFVLVDGALSPEIGRFVSSVQVDLRKRHASGEETLRELVVNTALADPSATLGPLTYNNLGDDDRTAWLEYDVRTSWSFFGGGRYESGWRSTSAATVHLGAPYRRQTVELVADFAALAARGVRAVSATVSTDFFGRRRSERRSVRVTPETAGVEPIHLVLPEGVYDYGYDVTWVLAGGERRRAQGTDDLGFLFLDDLPPAPDPGSEGSQSR